jgi:predicted porin
MQRDDYYWIGGTYQATSAVGLTLEYSYDNLKRDFFNRTNAPNPWQIAFIADYSLSKRTDLYLSTAYAKHAGLTLDSANTNQLATTGATGNSYILGTGQTSMLGVSLGIRHKF